MRLLLGALLLLPSLCHAWDGEGHQIVALIAEEQLTPAAKAAAKELLDGANISDAEVVNWADEILHFVWDTLIVRDMIGKGKIADVAPSSGPQRSGINRGHKRRSPGFTGRYFVMPIPA